MTNATNKVRVMSKSGDDDTTIDEYDTQREAYYRKLELEADPSVWSVKVLGRPEPA